MPGETEEGEKEKEEEEKEEGKRNRLSGDWPSAEIHS